MNTPKSALNQKAQFHRNLKLVATVATVATALRCGPFSRCHLIKEVATGGNTNTFLNIRACLLPCIWLSLLPLKMKWQQIGNTFHLWKARFRALLPPLPPLPPFFNSQQHVIRSNQGTVTL